MKILIGLLCCALFAAVGAAGERLMRYGREKNFKEECEEKNMQTKNTEEKIKVIIKPVGASAYFAEIENSLESLQSIVGGYIETLTVAEDMVIVCNEEGRINNSRFNTALCGEQFFGTVLLCGCDGEEFTSIPVSEDTARRIFCSLFASREI